MSWNIDKESDNWYQKHFKYDIFFILIQPDGHVMFSPIVGVRRSGIRHNTRHSLVMPLDWLIICKIYNVRTPTYLIVIQMTSNMSLLCPLISLKYVNLTASGLQFRVFQSYSNIVYGHTISNYFQTNPHGHPCVSVCILIQIF